MSDSPQNEDLSGLPPAERACRYRELADLHARLAAEAHLEQARGAHLELAALWGRLASQADHQAEGAADRNAGNRADLSGQDSVNA